MALKTRVDDTVTAEDLGLVDFRGWTDAETEKELRRLYHKCAVSLKQIAVTRRKAVVADDEYRAAVERYKRAARAVEGGRASVTDEQRKEYAAARKALDTAREASVAADGEARRLGHEHANLAAWVEQRIAELAATHPLAFAKIKAELAVADTTVQDEERARAERCANPAWKRLYDKREAVVMFTTQKLKVVKEAPAGNRVMVKMECSMVGDGIELLPGDIAEAPRAEAVKLVQAGSAVFVSAT